MSAVVRTHTLFLDKECLLEALDVIGTKYTVQGNMIVTDRVDYYGPEKFIWENDRFLFVHDSTANKEQRYPWNRNNLKEWVSVGSFLRSVDAEYRNAYGVKMERIAEEERRAEEERIRNMIEGKRSEIIAKAREKGYYIKETKEGNQIQLVLTRTV